MNHFEAIFFVVSALICSEKVCATYAVVDITTTAISENFFFASNRKPAAYLWWFSGLLC